jgi:adenine-specific DNA-methyltransferase
VLSRLKNGPLCEEIEENGGIKLIYIYPPFYVWTDFGVDIEIGSDTFTQKLKLLEILAYHDTWDKSADCYISIIYERLCLIRDSLV